MQILTGTKREITLMQWNEELEKANKRLADSRRVQERFGDNQKWVEHDEKKVKEIQDSIRKIIEFMDKNNIK